MSDKPLSDFQFSCLKMDGSKDIRDLSRFFEDISSFMRNATSSMREIESYRSALDRAVDEKVREVQRNAGKTNPYSSFSYSGPDYQIREAKAKLERCLSTLSREISQLAQRYDCAKSAERGLGEKFQKIMDSYKNIADAYEKLGQKQSAGASAMTAIRSEVNASADRRVDEMRRAFEKQISDLKRTYEQEIIALKEVVKKEPSSERRKPRKTASLRPEEAVKKEPSSEDVRVTDSDEQMTKPIKHASANEYAELWNKILDDDVVEMREVQEIKNWIENNSCPAPEFAELGAWCDSILARGEILPNDVRLLYDCSFRLLKALGAKID